MTSHLRCLVPPLQRATIAGLLILCSLGITSVPCLADDVQKPRRLESFDNPPDLTRSSVHATSAAATISFGRFTSTQANVDATGANILGDAANEPSIAVDLNHPNRIAIGWRQFDSILSSFREAGYGFSTNGGLNWATGKIDPGVFRSDPVLGSDAQGKFFYMSGHLELATGVITTTLFTSTNQGMTWGTGVPAFGGDKEWMAIDRTSGIGHDNVYETWAFEDHPPTAFSRSVDNGQTFQSPTKVNKTPIFGTMDVGPDGTVYLVGMDLFDPTHFLASRSSQAQRAQAQPAFVTVPFDLGGFMVVAEPPNDIGLLGQPWIAADPSPGREGWVYVLCSVRTPTDPMDVMFSRSTDGGKHWSPPVRVNDDAPGNRAFQWFGTMSVSPNGRIDAVWNDTRGSSDSTKSALYYASSTDGGVTWSHNEQASPVWDCTLGYPNNRKIGDYYHMLSDETGADLAWAATFNGEQDVYYMRVTPPTGALVAKHETARLRIVGNTPNPITSAATIRFDVPNSGGRARIEVFDASGRRVSTLVDGFVKGGTQSVRWEGTDEDGRTLKSGVYLCRLEAAGAVETVKLMLLR